MAISFHRINKALPSFEFPVAGGSNDFSIESRCSDIGETDETYQSAKAPVSDDLAGNWPGTQFSLALHMHFRELAEVWRIERHNESYPHSSDIKIDTFLESRGETVFDFLNYNVARAFVERFGLDEFVVRMGALAKSNWPPVYSVVLKNNFRDEKIREFLTVLAKAMDSLSVIADERRYAIHIDRGRIGYITVDHFATRERIELNRIRTARQALVANG